MIKQILFVLLASCILNSVDAQDPVLQPSSPELAGMSSERLKIIDTLVQGYINRKWYADAAAIIVHNGKIVYYKGFGYDDMDKKTPMPKDKIFRIASQTKAITSTAVMILYEEGKFLLDDPISKYIPEFHNSRVLDQLNERDSSYTTVP